MILKDFYTQLIASLKSMVYTGTSDKIFDQVVKLVPEIPNIQKARYRGNQCFIVDGVSTPLNEHNVLFTHTFYIYYLVENFSDPFGEFLLLGGNGKPGLLDIEKDLIKQLEGITSLNSQKISIITKERRTENYYNGNSPDVMRAIACEVFYTSDIGAETDIDEVNFNDGGRLFWNPVDIPNGNFGTRLGYMARGLTVNPNIRYHFDRTPDGGATELSALFIGSNPTATGHFSSYSSNVVNSLYGVMGTGKKITIPASLKTGAEVTANGNMFGSIFFAPTNPKNIAIHMKKVLPIFQEFSTFRKGSITTLSATFKAFGSTNDVLIMQPLESFLS